MARASTTKQGRSKKPKPVRLPSVILTEKQEKYVEARLNNATPHAAAKQAGYASPSASSATVEQSLDVQQALANARSALQTATKITREDVLEMFQDAYRTAKVMSESSAMTAAAREIGKMLGYYEPERIKIEMSMDQAKLQKKFEIMSDEQLLELVNGTAAVIEGEFTHVN